MDIKDGGPAFPLDYEISDLDKVFWSRGISKRDYFAAKAMLGMLIQTTIDIELKEQGAKAAYEWADAMLKESEK